MMRVSVFIVISMVIGILLVTSVALGAQYLQVPTIAKTPFSSILGSNHELTTPPLGRTVVHSPVQHVFLPFVSGKVEQQPWINPGNRQESLDFFNQVYLASEGVNSGWTGDLDSCVPGQTSDEFMQAVQQRINYFRSMAGVPGTVQLDDIFSNKAQQAALMMSVNGQLSHNPPPSWECYTAEGAQAAGSSNLALGVYGPEAITLFMYDPGSGNYFVGHRRWILYPQTQSMGTGDIPVEGNNWSANPLWVFDQNMWEPRPQTREEYVAWPPAGFVPYQVVFPRWSFAYDEADFSAATVAMSSDGQPITVLVKSTVNGYGENTLVWEPQVNFGVPPAADTTYEVTISDVKIDNVSHEFSYQVILFDPGSMAGMATSVPAGELNVPPLYLAKH
jgi:uncharacterized protein YkwD